MKSKKRKTKHSPAPWHWWDEKTPGHPRPKNYDLAKLIAANGSVVFTLYGDAGLKALRNPHNAALIAKAPELREFVLRWQGMFCGQNPRLQTLAGWQKAFYKEAKALLKGTG